MTATVEDSAVDVGGIDTGDPTECGPCEWFGHPGVGDNDPKGVEPIGPITEAQRCEGCGELVCNRHTNAEIPVEDRSMHFLAGHGEPVGEFASGDGGVAQL